MESLSEVGFQGIEPLRKICILLIVHSSGHGKVLHNVLNLPSHVSLALVSARDFVLVLKGAYDLWWHDGYVVLRLEEAEEGSLRNLRG